MTDRSEWQSRTGDSWAAEWRRTDQSFAQLTARLLERIGACIQGQLAGGRGPGLRVLDIGCGAGELSLAIADTHREAQVTGLDISPSLIAAAQQRADGGHRRNAEFVLAEFVLADAASWQAPVGTAPDLLVSRHGVMFFDDPPAAFANLANVAAPGASLMFSCFREVAANPFFTRIAALLPLTGMQQDPRSPGPFAFADPSYVTQVLEAGGWCEVAFEAVDFAMIVGAGKDPAAEAMAYFARIGPAAQTIGQLDGAERELFLRRLRAVVEAHHRDGLVALPAAAWIVTARAP